jgi:hypothetical protein
MRKLKVISGENFGRLTVVDASPTILNGHTNVLCKCDCGEELLVRISSLKSNHTLSCGCYNKSIITTHGLTNHPLFYVWVDMKSRCTIKSNHAYKNYGARGICVCDEWVGDFKMFYDWAVENGWKKGLHLDRIDNDDWYKPSNCQFITSRENLAVGKRNRYGVDVGASYDNLKKHWVASVYFNGKNHKVRFLKSKEEALIERVKLEIKLYGKQLTNFHLSNV